MKFNLRDSVVDVIVTGGKQNGPIRQMLSGQEKTARHGLHPFWRDALGSLEFFPGGYPAEADR